MPAGALSSICDQKRRRALSWERGLDSASRRGRGARGVPMISGNYIARVNGDPIPWLRNPRALRSGAALLLAGFLSQCVAQTVQITQVGQWPGYERGRAPYSVAAYGSFAYLP